MKWNLKNCGKIGREGGGLLLYAHPVWVPHLLRSTSRTPGYSPRPLPEATSPGSTQRGATHYRCCRANGARGCREGRGGGGGGVYSPSGNLRRPGPLGTSVGDLQQTEPPPAARTHFFGQSAMARCHSGPHTTTTSLPPGFIWAWEFGRGGGGGSSYGVQPS